MKFVGNEYYKDSESLKQSKLRKKRQQIQVLKKRNNSPEINNSSNNISLDNIVEKNKKFDS